MLGPILYLLYTSNLQIGSVDVSVSGVEKELRQATIADPNVVATLADETAILAIGDSNKQSTEKLQAAGDEVQRWTLNYRIN